MIYCASELQTVYNLTVSTWLFIYKKYLQSYFETPKDVMVSKVPKLKYLKLHFLHIMTWKFRPFPRVNISVQIIFIIRTKNRETLNFHVIMIKILTDTHGIFPQNAMTASLVLLQILSWKLGYHSVHSWFFCSSFAVRLRTVSTMRTVRQCSDMWSVRINRTVLSVRIC